ncbi:MAG: DUF2141 domain-containing protein [Bacteroidota bacterium]
MRLLLVLLLFMFGSTAEELSLELTTTAQRQGCIRIAVYATEAGYAAGESVSARVVKLDRLTTDFSVALKGLAPGEYVVAAYHDVNENGKLDKSLLGMPKEPYGFAREPLNKWSRPTWDEIAIEYGVDVNRLKIDLKTWKER